MIGKGRHLEKQDHQLHSYNEISLSVHRDETLEDVKNTEKSAGET